MKLIETMSDITNYGIFKSLYNAEYFSWLTEEDAVNLDILYYNVKSGQKSISKLLYNLYNNSSTDCWNNLAPILYVMYKDSWDRLYEVMVSAEYNPIHNYNMTETENQSTDISYDNDYDNKVSGFNSGESTELNNGNSNREIKGDFDKNKRQLTKSGNIGVTTTQKMISEEIKLRKNKFFDFLFKDIDKILCLSVYE